MKIPTLWFYFLTAWILLESVPEITAQEAARPRRPNLILVLSDDHRYDFMSFHPKAPDFLETPNLDRMATQGAHFKNAFVTTSLCSPSRASILTGQTMRRHRVIDNQRPVSDSIHFFPQTLQDHGYRTAFVGKWHMGHDIDSPQKGFHHWVSFRGQGEYFNPTFNINGTQEQQSGYIDDLLTDQALEWLKGENQTTPFFLYLSFKSVHYPFMPAPRNHGRYQGKPIPYPPTMANTERNYEGQPHWVRERRYGIHGIDHMQTGAFDNDPVPSFDDLYYRYCETVHGLDENMGRLLSYLDQNNLSQNTWILYLGDNGFALGEHGFYDKRDAFETSIRVPLLAYAPGNIAPGTVPSGMALNIDLAPTFLDIAGISPKTLSHLEGSSLLPWLRGETPAWRDHIIYEYYWEWNFPATPSTFAIRTDRYKYIFYHGVWDRNGLYDLELDPLEKHNLIELPAYKETATTLQNRLFEALQNPEEVSLPIRPPVGEQYYDRKLRR